MFILHLTDVLHNGHLGSFLEIACIEDPIRLSSVPASNGRASASAVRTFTVLHGSGAERSGGRGAHGAGRRQVRL